MFRMMEYLVFLGLRCIDLRPMKKGGMGVVDWTLRAGFVR
jgi:hypothetical protein